MSEFEIRQLQERIDAGVLLAQKRLIERTKRENGDLVVIRDGKIMHLPPSRMLGGIFLPISDNLRSESHLPNKYHLRQ